MEYMDGEMLRAETEEATAAATDARARGAGVMVEALRVMRMVVLRADGHLGANMHPFPFAKLTVAAAACHTGCIEAEATAAASSGSVSEQIRRFLLLHGAASSPAPPLLPFLLRA